MLSWTWRGCAVAALASVLACSGEEARTSATTANHDPEIQNIRLEPADPVSGDLIRADVRARDEDGDEVEIRYDWKVGGIPAQPTGPELRLGEVRKGTIIEVTATATDGLRTSDPAHASVRVRNRRPRLNIVHIRPWDRIALGQTLVARAEGADPDGDPLRYEFEWRVNGDPIQHHDTAYSTAGLSPGDLVEVRATALDGEDASDPIASAAVRVVGSNPEIVSNPSGFSGDGTFRYQVEVVHPDGDRNLRYSLKAAPEGMQVDLLTGAVTWAPRNDQLGDFPVAIAVEDAQGAVTVQEFELQVGGASMPANQAGH